MEYLQSRATNTLATSGLNMGYQPQAPTDAGCTPDTSDTPGMVRSLQISPATSKAKAKASFNTNSEPDRWCWPYSSAMTSEEIRRLMARIELFADRGVSLFDATLTAEKLLVRDREGDDRRLCFECAALAGTRCRTWREAGIGVSVLPSAVIFQLQRCDAFVSA